MKNQVSVNFLRTIKVRGFNSGKPGSAYDFQLLECKSKIGRNIAVLVISGLFSLLFLYAATLKIFNYQEFKSQLSQAPFLAGFSTLLAWMVPVSELFVSVLLFLPGKRRWGLYASLTLIIVFSVYIIALLNFSSFIPCGCGGILSDMNWDQHLKMNMALLLIAVTGVCAERY